MGVALFKTWQGVVAAMAAMMCCRMLGVFIVLPVASAAAGSPASTALYGRALLGWEVGVLLGGYGLAQACLQIPLGVASDRLGRRRVLCFALLVFVAGGAMAALATTPAVLLAGRLLQGAGATAAVMTAWIADITPPPQRPLAMAAFGVGVGVAFVIATFIAAPMLLAAVAGYAPLPAFFSFAATSGVIALGVLFLLPSPPVPSSDDLAKRKTAWRALFANGRLWHCAGGAFALHYALAVVFFLLPLLLLPHIKLGAQWQVLAGGFVLALLPGFLILGRIARFPILFSLAQILLLAGVASLAILPTGMLSPSVAALAAVFFFFVGFLPLEAALPAHAAEAVSSVNNGSNQHGGAMGVVYTAQFLGIFAGAAAAGICVQNNLWGVAIAKTCIIIIAWLALHGYRNR